LNVDATSARALTGAMFDGVVRNHGLADIDDLDGPLATVARVLRPGRRFGPVPMFLVVRCLAT